jgi:hypothetical protein
MNACAKCGREMERQKFEHCGEVEFCSRCETIKYVRSKIYLNGKELEYCVEVNTQTRRSRVVSSKET